MSDEVHICSLLVHFLPDRRDRVLKELAGIKGASLPYADQENKVVVVLEADGEKQMIERVSMVSASSGVVSSNMVFQQHERKDIIDEEILV